MFDKIRNKLLENYKETDFLNGGCYIYAKLVTNEYGGDIYINRLLEHCAIMYKGELYDITGKIKSIENFHPFRKNEEKMCEKEYRLKGKTYIQILKEIGEI